MATRLHLSLALVASSVALGSCTDSSGLNPNTTAGTESGTDSTTTDSGSTTDESTSSSSTTDPSTTADTNDSATTVPTPDCGNGDIEAPEECDDGNTVNGDGCEGDCTLSTDTLLWEVTHAGDAGVQDRGQGITTDAAGNVYVIGYEVDTLSDADIWVRKLDANGDGVWFSNINPSSGRDDRGHGIAVDGSGNVIVVGTMSTDEVETDIYLAQLDTDGVPVWSQSVSGTEPGADGGHDVAVDGSDNLVFVGYVRVGPNDNDIWVRKTDNGGTEIWTDVIPGPDNLDDRAQGVAIDDADNIYVVGFIANTGFNNDVWLRKYDSDGVEQWTTIYDSVLSGSESGFDVEVAPDGSIAVAGTTPIVANNDDVWLGRFDGDTGDLIWQRDFGSPAIADDRGFGIAVDSENNYIIAGFKGLEGTDRDIWIRKWNAGGGVVWTQNIIGAGLDRDEAVAVAVDGDDNIVVTGEIRPEANNNGEIWVAKFSP